MLLSLSRKGPQQKQQLIKLYRPSPPILRCCILVLDDSSPKPNHARQGGTGYQGALLSVAGRPSGYDSGLHGLNNAVARLRPRGRLARQGLSPPSKQAVAFAIESELLSEIPRVRVVSFSPQRADLTSSNERRTPSEKTMRPCAVQDPKEANRLAYAKVPRQEPGNLGVWARLRVRVSRDKQASRQASAIVVCKPVSDCETMASQGEGEGEGKGGGEG